VKPLDLNVGIQNSYEAARSESVRLEKAHVVNMLAEEDAKKEQVARDQKVLAPEPSSFSDDVFSADRYEAPDYTDLENGQDKHKKKRREKKSKDEAETEEPTGSDDDHHHDGGFSTFA
jgi:hypothetical protein